MSYYYRFEPGNVVIWIGNLSRHEAEKVVEGALRLASQVLDVTPPQSIVLYNDGVEVLTCTQEDRRTKESPARD